MFSEIVNYIVIPTLLSASALGAYYIWSPEDSKKLISSVAWYGVNMYSRAAIYYETFAQYEYDLSDDEMKMILTKKNHYPIITVKIKS